MERLGQCLIGEADPAGPQEEEQSKPGKAAKSQPDDHRQSQQLAAKTRHFGRIVMPDTSGQGRQHNGQHAKPYRHRQIDQIEDEDIGIDRLADAIAPGNGHLFGGAGQLADKYEQRDPHSRPQFCDDGIADRPDGAGCG